MKNIILILFLLNPWNAFACSCIPTKIGDEKNVTTKSYNGSSAVVVAKAISVEEDKVDHGYEITEFLVIRSWKGAIGDHFRTRIYTGCCMCGRSFAAGVTYLLYLGDPDKEGFYHASICDRDSPFNSDSARKDIQLLNEFTFDQK